MRNQWGSTARALRVAALTLFSGAALAAGLPGREGILVTPEQEGLAGEAYGYRRGLVMGGRGVEGGGLIGALELGSADGPWENAERLRKINGLVRYAGGDDSNGLSITGMAYANRWNSTDQIPLRAVDSG